MRIPGGSIGQMVMGAMRMLVDRGQVTQAVNVIKPAARPKGRWGGGLLCMAAWLHRRRRLQKHDVTGVKQLDSAQCGGCKSSTRYSSRDSDELAPRLPGYIYIYIEINI